MLIKMKKETWVALLTIKSFPRTNEDNERLVNWLIATAKSIKRANPDTYNKTCRFRLMER